MWVVRALSFALVTTAGAFASPPSPEASRSSSETPGLSLSISGGKTTQGDRSSVAFCFGTDPPARCLFGCSGTLIAPNLVLTARHCFQTLPDDKCETQFGPLKEGLREETVWVTTEAVVSTSSPASWYQAKSFRFPSANRGCGTDLALVQLRKNVAPNEATPATPALRPAYTDKSFSRNVVMIGFGGDSSTGTAESGVGTRRIRTGGIVECIPGDPSINCEGRFADDIRSPREFLVREGGCSGDSGSGAFDQGAYASGKALQVGILSKASLVGCTANVYTRIDAWAGLIKDAAEKAAEEGSYPLPAWASVSFDGLQPGSETPFPYGEPGAECESNEDCKSGACASDDNFRHFTCTVPCESGGCAKDFVCRTSSNKSQCFYEAPVAVTEEKCSCSIPSRTPVSAKLSLFAALGLAFAVRRRKQA